MLLEGQRTSTSRTCPLRPGLAPVPVSFLTPSRFPSPLLGNIQQDVAALLGRSTIKDIVATFGVESVVLWNAMLMKKRVVVLGVRLRLLRPLALTG